MSHKKTRFKYLNRIKDEMQESTAPPIDTAKE